jgi:hypothetical protein
MEELTGKTGLEIRRHLCQTSIGHPRLLIHHVP